MTNMLDFWDAVRANPQIEEFISYNSRKRGDIQPDLIHNSIKKFYNNPQFKKITMTCSISGVW